MIYGWNVVVLFIRIGRMFAVRKNCFVGVITLLTFFSVCLPSPGVGPTKGPSGKKKENGSGIEAKVVAELNLARTKPKEYAKYLEEHRNRFKEDMVYTTPDGMNIRTQEGTKAVDEAIAFL